MRVSLKTVVILLALGAGVALADYVAVQPVHQLFQAGLTIGGIGTKLDDSYATPATIDFAGVTDQCEDSSGITVTGAAVNDGCVVGPPATMPCAHCWLSCYVSAADTVKVRLCAHGASGNPASATYSVRTLDP